MVASRSRSAGEAVTRQMLRHWQEAVPNDRLAHLVKHAARGLARARDTYGPQSVGVLASARLTMEENFLLQKLARTALRTNSIHSCEAT